MNIDIYSHCIAISEVNERQRAAVEKYARSLLQYEMVIEDGQKLWRPTKVFASSDVARTTYRFHINCLNDLIKTLDHQQIDRDTYRMIHHPIVLDNSFRVEFVVQHLHDPRGPQSKILDYILEDGNPNKIVTLQPGGGKTLLSKLSMRDLGLRTAVIMKGGYIDRWVPDMEQSFKFKKGELLVVRGSIPLQAIQEMALDGEFDRVKVVFISTDSLSDYIKSYERHGVTEEYPVAPGEFFDRLRIGFAVLDEGHQKPHQVMKLFCYTHVHRFLTLSGTLDTMDAFMSKMYELMYPRALRCDGDHYDVFIRVTAVRYQLKVPRSLRYTGFGGAYNHTTFEASLMTKKNKRQLTNYLEMIAFYVKYRFTDVMEKGQKMIVFCGTIKFCTMLQKFLEKRFPGYKVVRYVSQDKMSVLNDGEIIVSTVLSAGTAVDIPNLRLSLMTTAIDSQQSNEQALGRTRRLKDWPDVSPEFLYFCCDDVPPHVKYHRHKMEFFKGKVLSHVSEQSPYTV